MAKKEGKMDMQEMMEVYKKVGTPGDHHKLLAKLVGSWTTKTRSWMEPDKPPMETTGMCEQKMLLGGRYLQQKYTGDMMGEPFTGYQSPRVRQPYQEISVGLDRFHEHRYLFL